MAGAKLVDVLIAQRTEYDLAITLSRRCFHVDKRANRRKCMVYAARALMVGYRESKGSHDGNANDEVAID